MSENCIFNRVLQIGIVVRDLKASIQKYEALGIGPWQVHTLDSSNVRNMTIRKESRDYSMKVAFSKIGNLNWELIEPLDNESIYAEFLKEHGEGIHHVAFDVEDFHETLDYFQEKGVGVLQGGISEPDFGFAYLDTGDALGCIAEIYDNPRKKIP